jgi:hypothetical protein
MRDELLNESLFFGLDHARAAITATGPGAALPDGSAPVARPAPHGVTMAETLNRRWMKVQGQVTSNPAT